MKRYSRLLQLPLFEIAVLAEKKEHGRNKCNISYLHINMTKIRKHSMIHHSSDSIKLKKEEFSPNRATKEEFSPNRAT